MRRPDEMAEPDSAPPSLRAFTLLEMLVILIIIGVMVALAAPSLGRFYEGVKLDSSVARFSKMLDAARLRAASGRSVCRLALEPAWRRIRLEAPQTRLIADPEDAVSFMKETGKRAGGLPDFVAVEGDAAEMELPSGVELAYVSISGVQAAPSRETFIWFKTAGAQDACDFVFRNGLKDYKGLRLESGFGEIRDLPVTKWE
jgi:type II secretory pathway pseudopilin PulG